MPAPNRKRRLTAFMVAMAVLIATPLAVIASDQFSDVPDSNVFHDDIGWLADAGITKGCNPPDNTEFCPKDEVTRDQMSAFMRRFAQYLGAEDGTPAQADHATTADSAATADTATNAGDADNLDGLDSAQYLRLDTVLADGETLVGVWGVSAHDDGYAFYQINFDPVLPGELPVSNMHYIEGNAFTPDCPGFGQAAPGHLCVYEAHEAGLTHQAFGDPESNQAGSASYGVVPFFVVDGSFAFARGNWAVTGWSGTLSSSNSKSATPKPAP